jgi:hypothetical protein
MRLEMKRITNEREKMEQLINDPVTGAAFPMSDVPIGPSEIEAVGMADILEGKKELEAFMNEKLVVMVFPDPREGELRAIRVDVNNHYQIFPRGAQVKCKRKYVEALSRCVRTTYEQKLVDPSDLTSHRMFPTTTMFYPFSVIHDPNPMGAEWLKRILAERK